MSGLLSVWRRVGPTRTALRAACTSTVVIVLGAMCIAPGLAGEYKLVEGQGKDVCEAYRKNLEPRHDPKPMACEREYASAIAGFSAPAWRKLDITKHRALFLRAWIYFQKHNTSPQGIKLSDAAIERDAREYLQAILTSGRVEMLTASLDLAGDGKLHKVLAVRLAGCGPDQEPTHTTEPFVLDESGRDIDRNVPKDWNLYYNSTIELFNGRAYLESYVADDDWGMLLKGSGELSVLQYTQAGLVQTCGIRWTPDSTANK
jgi:hypothetical protein